MPVDVRPERLLWVKPGNTRSEQITSAVLLEADIAQMNWAYFAVKRVAIALQTMDH